MPLTFHESRERCLKLRRLVSLAKSLSNGIALELIVRYLTGKQRHFCPLCYQLRIDVFSGNLKINLKPLWSEAVAGIVTLAPDHEELVWRIAGHALLATASADFKQAVEAWKNASGSPTEDRWDDLFEDRSLDQLSKSLDQNIDVYIQVSILCLGCVCHSSLLPLFRTRTKSTSIWSHLKRSYFRFLLKRPSLHKSIPDNSSLCTWTFLALRPSKVKDYHPSFYDSGCLAGSTCSHTFTILRPCSNLQISMIRICAISHKVTMLSKSSRSQPY